MVAQDFNCGPGNRGYCWAVVEYKSGFPSEVSSEDINIKVISKWMGLEAMSP